MTDAGRRLVDRVREYHVARVRTMLEVLTENEQVELQRLLDRIGEHVEVLADRPNGSPDLDEAGKK